MAKRKSRAKKPLPAARGRSADGRGHTLWLYGEHAVHAALANPRRQVHKLIASRAAAEGLERHLALPLSERRPALEVRVVEARDALSSLLPEGAVHQGLAALVSPLAQPALADLASAAPGRSLIVLLDQVTDPQNVGAILRSASAFGALAVVAPERHSADETGALAKAASGALEAIPYVRVVNLARSLDHLKDQGYWCLGLDSASDQTLDRIVPVERVALVLGAEGSGLRRLTRDHCDVLTRLPTRGPVAQLNVSNAAAVALYALLGAGSA